MVQTVLYWLKFKIDFKGSIQKLLSDKKINRKARKIFIQFVLSKHKVRKPLSLTLRKSLRSLRLNDYPLQTKIFFSIFKIPTIIKKQIKCYIATLFQYFLIH